MSENVRGNPQQGDRQQAGPRAWLLALLCVVGLLAAPLATAPAFAASPISAEYQRLGGAAGRMGQALTPERCTLVRSGCYQQFRGGDIHYSPATGAVATWGGIKGAWAAQRYERGKLGYPVRGEVCGLREGGCSQQFEGGTIYWTPVTYARPTLGAIGRAWVANGAERGALGYPVTGEICSGAGCRQAFERGTITWAPGRGAHVSRDIDAAPSLFVVVNKRRPLNPRTYAPANLVDVGNGQKLRADAAAAYQRLKAGAAADGVPVIAVSGYRSYAYQTTLHQYYIDRLGFETAVMYSLRPGHSEHQTGLALDLGNADGRCVVNFTCFDATPAARWAKANAHRYGFIVRYPEGQAATTGINPEGWHLRYVGTRISNSMVNEGIPTLEHYMGLPPAPTY